MPVFISGILLCLHWPFLQADPDGFISVGRDAFTDEGLNTSQLRNYINHGTLSFDECDNLIKVPLFNAWLFVPLYLFGTHLEVARLSVLVFVVLVVALAGTQASFRKIVPVMLFTTLIQYYVFQYSHFSLSEMVAVSCIFLCLLFLFRYSVEEKKTWLFLSCLFACAAVFAKIQYAYILFFPFISLVVLRSLTLIRIGSKTMSLALLFLFPFLLLYLLAWYLPHQGVFDLVLGDQSKGKFAEVPNMPRTFAFNIIHFLFNASNGWFNGLVLLCGLSGILIYRRSTHSAFKILFVLATVWTVIELHKFTMIYLPSRYWVSYYFAAGLLCSVVIAELLFSPASSRPRMKMAGWVLLIFFFAGNSIQYFFILERRTYDIKNINRYLAATVKKSAGPVLGVWSTSAAWDSKARAIPVWNNFMNDVDALNRFQPQAILSEPDEDESNRAFASKGIHLASMADSTRKFQVGRWEVMVCWIKAEAK
jgi:hypothetical protein